MDTIRGELIDRGIGESIYNLLVEGAALSAADINLYVRNDVDNVSYDEVHEYIRRMIRNDLLVPRRELPFSTGAMKYILYNSL